MSERKSDLDNPMTRRDFFRKAGKATKSVAAAAVLPKLESIIGPTGAEKKEYIDRMAILLEDPHSSESKLLPTIAEKESNPGGVEVRELKTENGKLFKIEVPFSALLGESKEDERKPFFQHAANSVWITFTRKSASYQFALGGINLQDTEKLAKICQVFSEEEREGLTFYLPEETSEKFTSKKYDNVIYPDDPHAGEPITSLNVLLMQVTPVISRHHDGFTDEHEFTTRNVAKPMAEYTIELGSTPFEKA